MLEYLAFERLNSNSATSVYSQQSNMIDNAGPDCNVDATRLPPPSLVQIRPSKYWTRTVPTCNAKGVDESRTRRRT